MNIHYKGCINLNYETIKLEIAERKATLTLNRPNALNAMDYTMMRELADCFEALHYERDVQILIIKGEGKVFSAGGDIKMMVASDDFSDFGMIMADISRLVKAFYTLPMITIAQIHGASAGLGFSLALGSDMIVAEQSSKLAMNFIGIGLIPDGAGHFFMKERLGTAKAKQMIWEGKVLNGEEALALGLIDYNVAEGASIETVDQLVGKLLASPILAMIETKKILHNANMLQLEQILEGESTGQVKMRRTEDHVEGIKAFVEKRMPKFEGK